MDTSTANPSFFYVTYIATTPEKLWQALTDGAFTKQYWAGTSIESEWTPSAPVRFVVNRAVHDSGVVLACNPYRHLSYSWHVEFHEAFRREKPSRVTFDIEPKAAEVKLTITHDEFEPGSKVYAAVSNGWPMVLASLKSLLETGRPLAMTSPESMEGARKEAIARAECSATRNS
jgi:uncharacterized protein YndB with AHSA1/START domain